MDFKDKNRYANSNDIDDIKGWARLIEEIYKDWIIPHIQRKITPRMKTVDLNDAKMVDSLKESANEFESHIKGVVKEVIKELE